MERATLDQVDMPLGAVALGKPTLEQVYLEGWQPIGRSHPGEGEKCAEEREAEMSCYGLTIAPIPQLLSCSGGGGTGVGNERVKLSMEKRWSCREGVVLFVFLSQHGTLF